MVSLLATVITVAASLYIFAITQWGPNRPYYLSVYPPLTKEHYSLLIHFAPLVLLIVVPDVVTRWNLCRHSLNKTLDCDSEDRG